MGVDDNWTWGKVWQRSIKQLSRLGGKKRKKHQEHSRMAIVWLSVWHNICHSIWTIHKLPTMPQKRTKATFYILVTQTDEPINQSYNSWLLKSASTRVNGKEKGDGNTARWLNINQWDSTALSQFNCTICTINSTLLHVKTTQDVPVPTWAYLYIAYHWYSTVQLATHYLGTATVSVREYVFYVFFSDLKKTWLFTFFWNVSKKRKKSQKSIKFAECL